MAVKDIFTAMSAHQHEGVMLHNDMADFFDFLGLYGYRAEHEAQYRDEAEYLRRIHRYFVEHYNQFLDPTAWEYDSRIPDEWRSITRQAVKAGDRPEAVRSCFETWIDWERQTKRGHEAHYVKLLDAGEIAAADFVLSLIRDVSAELRHAEEQALALQSMQYDMPTIEDMQPEVYQKYQKVLKKGGIIHDQI